MPSRVAQASIRRLVLEKVPLLLLSAADAVVTIRAQHTAVHTAMAEYSFHTRLANAMIAYSRYVAHAFWPFRLAPAYLLLDDAIPFAQVLTACAFLLLVTGLALASRKRYLLVGWLWFLGTLVPMIGVVQVGNQSTWPTAMPTLRSLAYFGWQLGLLRKRPRSGGFHPVGLPFPRAWCSWPRPFSQYARSDTGTIVRPYGDIRLASPTATSWRTPIWLESSLRKTGTKKLSRNTPRRSNSIGTQ